MGAGGHDSSSWGYRAAKDTIDLQPYSFAMKVTSGDWTDDGISSFIFDCDPDYGFGMTLRVDIHWGDGQRTVAMRVDGFDSIRVKGKLVVGGDLVYLSKGTAIKVWN